MARRRLPDAASARSASAATDGRIVSNNGAADGILERSGGENDQQPELFADLSRLQVISSNPMVSVVQQNRDVVTLKLSRRNARIVLTAWAPFAPVVPLPATTSAELGVLDGASEVRCSDAACSQLAERMGDLPRLGFPPLVTSHPQRRRSPGRASADEEDLYLHAVRTQPEAASTVRHAALWLPTPALEDWTEVTSRSILLMPGEITLTLGSTARILVDPGAESYEDLPEAYSGVEPWEIESLDGAEVVSAQDARHCDLPAGKGPMLQIQAENPGAAIVRFSGCDRRSAGISSEVRVSVVRADAVALQMQEELAGSAITDGDLPTWAVLGDPQSSGTAEAGSAFGDEPGAESTGLAEALELDRATAFESMLPSRVYVFEAELVVDGAEVRPVDPLSRVPIYHRNGSVSSYVAWHGLNVSCVADFEYSNAVATSQKRLYDGDVLAFPWDGVRVFKPVRGRGSVLGDQEDVIDAASAGFNKTQLEQLATRRLGTSPGCLVLVQRPVGSATGNRNSPSPSAATSESSSRIAASGRRSVGVPPVDGSAPSTIVVQMAALHRGAAGSGSSAISSPRVSIPFQPAMRLIAADSSHSSNPEADAVAVEFFPSEGWRSDVMAAQEPLSAGSDSAVNATSVLSSGGSGKGAGSSAASGSTGGSGPRKPSEDPELWAQVGVFLSGIGGMPLELCSASGEPSMDGPGSCLIVRASGFGWAAPDGAMAAAKQTGYSGVSANSSSLAASFGGSGPWDKVEVLQERSMSPVRRYVGQLATASRANGLHPDDSILSERPEHERVRLQRASGGHPLVSVVPDVLVQARVRQSFATRGDIADALCDRLLSASATL